VGGTWAGPTCRDRSVASCQPLVSNVPEPSGQIRRKAVVRSCPPTDHEGGMNLEVDYNILGTPGPSVRQCD